MRTVSIETTESNAFQAIEQRLCHIPDAAAFASRNLMKDAQRHVVSEVYKAVPTVYAIKEGRLRGSSHRVQLKAVQSAGHEAARGDILIRGRKLALALFDRNVSARRRQKLAHIVTRSHLAYMDRFGTGKHIPDTKMWKYPLRPSYTAQVHLYKDSPMTPLETKENPERGAFVARMPAVSKSGKVSYHYGIFERVGDARDFGSYTDRGNQRLQEKMGLSLPQMAGDSKVFARVGGDYAQYLDSRAEHYIKLILEHGVPTRKGGRR